MRTLTAIAKIPICKIIWQQLFFVDAILGPQTQDQYLFGSFEDSTEYVFVERWNASNNVMIYSRGYENVDLYLNTIDIDFNENFIYLLYQITAKVLFLKLNTSDGSVATDLMIDELNWHTSKSQLKTYTNTTTGAVFVYFLVNTDDEGAI